MTNRISGFIVNTR